MGTQSVVDALISGLQDGSVVLMKKETGRAQQEADKIISARQEAEAFVASLMDDVSEEPEMAAVSETLADAEEEIPDLVIDDDPEIVSAEDTPVPVNEAPVCADRKALSAEEKDRIVGGALELYDLLYGMLGQAAPAGVMKETPVAEVALSPEPSAEEPSEEIRRADTPIPFPQPVPAVSFATEEEYREALAKAAEEAAGKAAAEAREKAEKEAEEAKEEAVKTAIAKAKKEAEEAKEAAVKEAREKALAEVDAEVEKAKHLVKEATEKIEKEKEEAENAAKEAYQKGYQEGYRKAMEDTDNAWKTIWGNALGAGKPAEPAGASAVVDEEVQ